eukprot:4634016-Pyramimonas_sp.AAC.1
MRCWPTGGATASEGHPALKRRSRRQFAGGPRSGCEWRARGRRRRSRGEPARRRCSLNAGTRGAAWIGRGAAGSDLGLFRSLRKG